MKNLKSIKLISIILSVILIFAFVSCEEKDGGQDKTNDENKTSKTSDESKADETSTSDESKADETSTSDERKADETSTRDDGGEMVFRFNNGTEPQTLDPGTMTGVPESNICQQLFEGLTSHNPETLVPEPGVAERWELSDDGLTWTFYIRKDARWSDGTPITAETFKYSWIRNLDPVTASQYAQFLWDIENAEQYTKGEVVNPDEVGIKVINDHQLEVKLKTPVGYFLDLTCFHTFFPLPKHIIEQYGNDEWYRKENIVSNGPFMLDKWVAQQRLEMVPNPEYWDRDKVKLDRVVFYPHEDSNTALTMYLNGELDMTGTVPTQRLDEMKDRDDYHNDPYLGTYYYRFNVTRTPFDNVKVRKALAMAVDRQSIVRYITKAGQRPAYGFVPPTISGWKYKSTLTEDVEEAKRLLAEAGYPNGEGFPKMTLLYNTSDSHKPIAEAIVQRWKETLGIDMNIENQEWQVYLDLLHSLDYDVARAGWIGDYTDPNTFSDMMTTGNGNNNTGWSNKEYDDLVLNKGKYETDEAKRFEYFEKAEAILMEEMPIIPIYSYVSQWMLSPKVRGIYGNVRDIHPLKEVYIEN